MAEGVTADIPDAVLHAAGLSSLAGKPPSEDDDGALALTLPDGTHVIMREPDGDDMAKAQQMVSANAAPVQVVYAMIALCSTFNGQKRRYEDVRKMKVRQLSPLIRSFGDLTGPPPEAPATSTAPDSGA